jgi:hypothetical protein
LNTAVTGTATVGNNPMNLTDPSREGVFEWIGGIIGSFFGPSYRCRDPGGRTVSLAIVESGDARSGKACSFEAWGISGDLFNPNWNASQAFSS